MQKLTQIHHPDFSLWQSAIDQVVSTGSQRPDLAHSMVAGAAQAAEHLTNGLSLAHQAASPTGPPGAKPAGADAAKYCASIWFEIAKAKLAGDEKAEKAWEAQAGAFTSCDARYAEAVEQYLDFYHVKKGTVPYKVWQNLNDFIIDWKMPASARIAIVGDWGTGQPEAKALLEAIARKKPDAVIHLGDIYYSGTEFEMENYFLNIWSGTLDLTTTRTFTLAGNHDMYSGGGAYYDLIAKLGQPASHFCLRNDDWQFVALDTGLHDVDALDAQPTYLEDTEVAWLNDKIATAGSRRTVLLSHHQLFTAFEKIGAGFLNENLNRQVGPILPQVTAWLWGHEHNQVIYKPFQGVLGRCLGHGAYPVGITEIADSPQFPNVPLEDVRLTKGPSFYSHGYVVVDLDGPLATVSYYQDSDSEETPMFTETYGAATSGATS
jgi:predicted phosphodiesterase